MNMIYFKHMRNVTLCLLIKGDEVLLAMKKRGFGAGKWNGIGGKVNEGESIEAAAVREAEEEIGVKIDIKDLEYTATTNFFFKDKPEWNQSMKTFFVAKWEGEP